MFKAFRHDVRQGDWRRSAVRASYISANGGHVNDVMIVSIGL